MSPRAAWRLEQLGFSDVVDFVPGKEDWLANGLPVEGEDPPDRAGDHAEDVAVCTLDEPVDDVRGRVDASGGDRCVVVNEAGVVAGVLDRERLEEAREPRDGDVTAGELMRSAPTTFRPGVGAHELTHHLHDDDVDAAILTTNDGRLFGLFRPAA